MFLPVFHGVTITKIVNRFTCKPVDRIYRTGIVKVSRRTRTGETTMNAKTHRMVVAVIQMAVSLAIIAIAASYWLC